ncbi:MULTISPECIES: hypothetical protein [Paenibacillus]|uniref:hypothetical protein n=1 Tax=Paenibacillus TaxID=44249 RepID=UPI001C0FA1C4|nr:MULTISPECIES: hypothetical protein [Paenibacillus]MBU5443894.1 hypothetical protein [Paenibacillus sp. MSJ-34]
MNDDQQRFPSPTLSVPKGAGKQVTGYRNHSAESLHRREVQIGKTIYIVQSCYIGKDTLSDKIRRLVLRKWEDEQHRSE